MLRILFMGTPDFAIPALDSIYYSKHEIIGVVTQPDKPSGRSNKIKESSVKIWAKQKSILVMQPEKARNKDFVESISRLNPDLIITAAYGQILSSELLNIPRLGCVNIHASLLPEYRGASPIQQALLDGKKDTGITIIKMDEGMDTGDIILQLKCPIGDNENAKCLHDRLALLGAEAISLVLEKIEKCQINLIPQDSTLATYCSKITSEMGKIDWGTSSLEIQNHIRAMTPWPGAFSNIKETHIKIFSVEIIQIENNKYRPGEIVRANSNEGLWVASKDGFLRILQLQKAGKRTMSDLDFLKGNKLTESTDYFI